ncbi:monocyte to macrophage differentiation factor isoform X7 [Vicugna pacos]|uniref:Monocyte to macrophage differentiation factor isoform X7 n=1 Tax=Vicugna pacos TaxID=30538 RepID=A0ABM5BE72_VICPA
MRFQNRFQRFMNHPAPANGRYKPTCYEHAANCYTHAFLIVPAIVGSALLHWLSDDCWEKITAWIYGVGLCALFIVSTVFHIVSWKKSHLRTVEHCFHMCDRMVIYLFIAASYTPWYKVVELFFYLTMGFSPALVVTSMKNLWVDNSIISISLMRKQAQMNELPRPRQAEPSMDKGWMRKAEWFYVCAQVGMNIFHLVNPKAFS